MTYKCKDARKDIRFIFSKEAEEYPEKTKQAFKRFLNHIVNEEEPEKACSKCSVYHKEIKEKRGF